MLRRPATWRCGPHCLITRFLFSLNLKPKALASTVSVRAASLRRRPRPPASSVTHISVCPRGSSSEEPGQRTQEGLMTAWRGRSHPGDIITAAWFHSATRSIPQILCSCSPDRLSGFVQLDQLLELIHADTEARPTLHGHSCFSVIGAAAEIRSVFFFCYSFCCVLEHFLSFKEERKCP